MNNFKLQEVPVEQLGIFYSGESPHSPLEVHFRQVLTWQVSCAGDSYLILHTYKLDDDAGGALR